MNRQGPQNNPDYSRPGVEGLDVSKDLGDLLKEVSQGEPETAEAASEGSTEIIKTAEASDERPVEERELDARLEQDLNTADESPASHEVTEAAPFSQVSAQQTIEDIMKDAPPDFGLKYMGV